MALFQGELSCLAGVHPAQFDVEGRGRDETVLLCSPAVVQLLCGTSHSIGVGDYVIMYPSPYFHHQLHVSFSFNLHQQLVFEITDSYCSLQGHSS